MMRKGDFHDEPKVFRIFVHAWIFIGFAFAGIFFRSILIQKLTTLEYEEPVNSIQDLSERHIPVQDGETFTLMNNMYPQLGLDKLVDNKNILLPYKEYMKYIADGNKAAMFMADDEAYL